MAVRSRRIRNLAIMFVLTLVVAAISVYGFASVKAYDLVSLPPPHFTPATPTGSYETVTFPSRGQNYQVYGFLLPGTPHSPALVVVHGYKGSRYIDDQLSRAADYRSLSYTMLSIDLSDNAGDTVGNGR